MRTFFPLYVTNSRVCGLGERLKNRRGSSPEQARDGKRTAPCKPNQKVLNEAENPISP